MVLAFPSTRIAVAVLIPTFLFGIGQGAALPMIAVVGSDLGASLSAAGFLAALPLVGQLLGNLPSGYLVGRVGESKTMLWSAVATAMGAAISLAASTLEALAAGVLLMGLSAAAFGIARQAYITVRVDYAHRGRAFSTLAGANRFGMMLGPFVSALVLKLTDESQSPFGVAISVSLMIIVAVLIIGEVEVQGAPSVGAVPNTSSNSHRGGVLRTAWRSKRTLATVGLGAALLSGMRGSRITLVPLTAVSLELTSFQIALLVGIAAAVDFALFYPGGYLIDRFGRLSIGVSSMIGFGAAFVALGLTATRNHAVVFLVVVTLMLAVFNGLTSGIIATMGADLADPIRPTDFLACWRLTVDIGTASAPTAIAAIVALSSVSGAALVTGGLGYLGASIMWYTIPRHLPKRPRRANGVVIGPTA